MRKTMVVANWKMNGTRESVDRLLQSVRQQPVDPSKTEVIICPPYVYLEQTERLLKGTSLKWGGQNLHHQEKGAFTGEISAPMLRDFGCTYVIVGHSERRCDAAESDALVAQKFKQAVQHHLIPILCVGESAEERACGLTKSVVLRQLEAVLSVAGVAGFGQAVVAYEPVWAIGSGTAASPAAAEAVHKIIRDFVATRDKAVAERLTVLYGGSVDDQNIRSFLSEPDVDGVLVGGASLRAEAFSSMVQGAEN